MKKRTTTVAASLLAALLVAAFTALPVSTATGPLDGIKVCIDPGHGGADPGAVNEAYNLYESHINLDVSFALRDLLQASGAEVAMTRTEDVFMENRPRYTFCNEQQATILVSVHTNSSTSPDSDGPAALYFHADDLVLAESIYQVMLDQLGATAPPEVTWTPFGLIKYASGVLLKSDMPAALAEPLFMSHPYEAALLVQSIYGMPGCEDLSCRRGQIARSIHDGVVTYFGTPEPGRAMHIASIGMSYSVKGPNYLVQTSVQVVDDLGAPVPDATVAVKTLQPDGTEAIWAAVTGSNGVATGSVRSRHAGTYVSTVTGVSRTGWEYDWASNEETSETLVVP